MARSRVSEVMGLHLQDNHNYERMIAINAKNYTVLAEGASVIPAIRARVPDAEFTVRIRQVDPVDWSAAKHNPEGQAIEAMRLARDFKLGPRDIVVPLNEPNLADEKGGNQINKATFYGELGGWLGRFAVKTKELGLPCRIGGPALSPGHSEDQDDWGKDVGRPIIGFEILKPALDLFDVLILHCYWRAYDAPGGNVETGLIGGEGGPDDPNFWAFRDCVTYRKWFPNKPGRITEWNAPSMVDDPARWQPFANACDYFLRHVAETMPWIESADYFIYDSWDQKYQLDKMEPVYQRFKAIGHETVAGPTPPITPPPIEVPPVTPSPTTPDSEIARKYNLLISETAGIGVRFEDDLSGAVELNVYGPADLRVDLNTEDGRNPAPNAGPGHASVIMAATSKYFPENGQHGAWVAKCGGATLRGLGMRPDHTHPVTTFYRKVAEPPAPVEPPTPAYSPEGAFVAAYQPAVWGVATGPVHYPEVDDGPSESRPASQHYSRGLAYYTGSSVRWVARGT